MIVYVGIVLYFFLIIFLLDLIYVFIRQSRGKADAEYPPFFPSNGIQKKIIIERVSSVLEQSKEPLTIIDPGCGICSLLLPLAKKFPQHNFIGIDWDNVVYQISKLRARKLKNLKLIKGDMFKQSFKDADIIVCFLIDDLSKRFSEKVLTDIHRECKIFSNSFKLDDLPLIETIEVKKGILRQNVYIYELNKKA